MYFDRIQTLPQFQIWNCEEERVDSLLNMHKDFIHLRPAKRWLYSMVNNVSNMNGSLPWTSGYCDGLSLQRGTLLGPNLGPYQMVQTGKYCLGFFFIQACRVYF